jgi:hypothetical protein|tara:strand:+ start:146 stop:637 length:492 start_codon:yes stop_codon:yes gene_type:complete
MQKMIQVELTQAATHWMNAYFDDCIASWQGRQEGVKVGENSASEDMLEAWALADARGSAGEMPDVKWIKHVGKKDIYEATEEAVEAMINELKYWEGYCADLSWAGDATPLQASAWSRSCKAGHKKMQAVLDQHRQDFFNGETSRTFEDAEYAFRKARYELLNE